VHSPDLLQRFLGTVTYGPSGYEYTASNCTVTTPHTAITCYYVPGTGRKLYWIVNVGGQQSLISPAATSYAGPNITSIEPPGGLTDGGGIVTVTGSNFGLAYASSKLLIKLNRLMTARPSASVWSGWFNSILAVESSPSEAADAWLADIFTVPPLTSVRAGAVESVSFVVPPGFGPADELLVVVDGIPSPLTPATVYAYAPPVITNLAPDRELLGLLTSI
jgi:hypothetical protein